MARWLTLYFDSVCSSVVTAPRTSRNTDADSIVTYGDGDWGGVAFGGQYKRVRDMDYVKPPVIMRVKESGELYVPNPDKVINY